jgi:transposase
MLRNVLERPKNGFVLRHRAPGNSMVLGLAINRDGLPVRHWIFPGNTADVTTVEEVVNDLLGLRPRRFLFIGDRGMVSQKNLDFLESRRLHYLLGSKLRDTAVVQEKVLSLRGR